MQDSVIERWAAGPVPKDGGWYVILYEDGSGASVVAFYHDTDGNVGFHNAEGGFETDRDISAHHIPAPQGFVPWIESDAAALFERSINEGDA